MADRYTGIVVFLQRGTALEMHINIEEPSKDFFKGFYVWLHEYIVPTVKANGFDSIVCDDSGTANLKLIKLFKDFGFTTKTVTEGELLL